MGRKYEVCVLVSIHSTLTRLIYPSVVGVFSSLVEN